MLQCGLDSLTLTDTLARDTIRAAQQAGFDLVSLWTIAPAMYPKQLLTPAMARECAAVLADGIRAYSVEAFDLTSVAAAQAARPAIELGARLGAQVVLALHYANPDRGEAAAALAALAEVAKSCGLGVNVEPVAMGQTRSLAQAAALIGAAGVDAGILFDTYHFARIGGCAADITALEPGLIRYVQVCDGMPGVPAEQWTAESLQERLYPGDGGFALVEMLRLMPRDIPWAVETPSLQRAAAGMKPEVQARQAKAALERVLEAVAF